MLVHIENLVKRYGDLLALDHLSLDIEKGEIFGLLGPNGSGKTTAINCLLALLKYDKGTITIFGKDMKPDSYDIKQDIGVVMQNVAVFEQMSVYETSIISADSISKTNKNEKNSWKRPSHLPVCPISVRCARRNSPADFYED